VTLLLAYVMVHEVTHILQGITRRSKRGILKAHWDRDDSFEIGLGCLRFAEADVELIYSGPDAQAPAPTLGAPALADSRNAAPVAVQQ
jgi:hypothetical protein